MEKIVALSLLLAAGCIDPRAVPLENWEPAVKFVLASHGKPGASPPTVWGILAENGCGVTGYWLDGACYIGHSDPMTRDVFIGLRRDPTFTSRYSDALPHEVLHYLGHEHAEGALTFPGAAGGLETRAQADLRKRDDLDIIRRL